MKQGKLFALIDKGKKVIDENQREIMLGGAIAGVVVTVVTSWRAGIKADKILQKHKVLVDKLNELDMTEEEKTNKRKEITLQTVKEITPVVIPPMLSATGTIISVVGGYKVASHQIATLSALYSMSEKAYHDYVDKTNLIAGPKKVQEIEEAVAKDKVGSNPPQDRNTIINTGRGNVLFLDPVSGRYFYSKPEDVKRAVNAVNNETNVDGYFTELNEFYDELGIPTIDLGKMVGFPAGNLIDIDRIFTVILDESDNPVYILNYEVKPGHGYFYE